MNRLRLLRDTPTARALFAAGLHAASQLWVVSLLARYTTPAELGHYVLGYAIGAPVFMWLGARQRIVLANDTQKLDPTRVYLRFRLKAGALAVLTIAIGAWTLAPADKAGVIILVAVIKAAESISDLCYGSFQRAGHAKTAVRRIWQRALWMLALTSLTIPSLRSVTGAALTVLVVWTTFAVLDWRHLSLHNLPGPDPVLTGRARPSRQLFTLGLTALLASLAYYVPRYGISVFGDDRDLGYYGAVSYFGLLMLTVGHALTDYAMPALAQKHRGSSGAEGYHRATRRVYAVLIVLAGLALGGMAFFGAALLELLFGPAYRAYHIAGLVLIAAGSVAALNACQAHVVVTLGQARHQTAIGAICFLVLIAFCAVLIPFWGILGAALAELFYVLLYFLIVERLIRRCTPASLPQ